MADMAVSSPAARARPPARRGTSECERALDDVVPPICANLRTARHLVARRHLGAGATLFAEDDVLEHVHVLVEGWAAKYVTLLDGRRQILDFALPGEFLSFLGPARARHAVEMLTQGEVLAVPRATFEQQLLGDSRTALMIARLIEAAEARAYDHIANIGQRSARLRVCRLLIELAGRTRARNAATPGVRLRLPLRQAHIGDATGLRVETVCRVLVQLRAEGLATLHDNILEIPDMDALARAAEWSVASDGHGAPA